MDTAIHASKLCMALNPTWPSALGPVTVAQEGLESAYGIMTPAGSHNPFGIKAAGDEPYVEAMTWEVVNGQRVNEPQRFRIFASLADAFAAHGALIVLHPHTYHMALAFPNDPHAFANGLTGVYATDPQYGQKLCTILDRDVLPRWDYLS